MYEVILNIELVVELVCRVTLTGHDREEEAGILCNNCGLGDSHPMPLLARICLGRDTSMLIHIGF